MSNNSAQTKFNGKLVSIMGDSISTFEGIIPDGWRVYYSKEDDVESGITDASMTWWMLLADALGAEVLVNSSYSGSTVAGISFPVCSSKERAQALLGKNGEKPDIVFVFAGINDYGWGDADAQLRARAKSMPQNIDISLYPEAEAGLAIPGAIQEFEDAYTNMLENILEVAPDAEIYCMTLLPGRIDGEQKSTFCYSLRGVSLDEYNNAIKRACENTNSKFLDIRGFGYDYSSTDGTHPNVCGMKQLAALTEAAISEISDNSIRADVSDSIRPTGARSVDSRSAMLDSQLFPEYMKSRRLCSKNNCINCEYAWGYGNQWSCVCGNNM